MEDNKAAVTALIDGFVEMIRTRDEALIDRLWGDGQFRMIGSEVGEICRTREDLAAKVRSIFRNPTTFVFEFPARDLAFAGPVAWAFLDGQLTRHAVDGSVASRPYLASCIFEKVGARWYWRQFFGSEPY